MLMMKGLPKKGKDLRKYPRVDVHIKADYQIIPPVNPDERISVDTKNISIGGLMFYTTHPITIGSHLDIRLYLKKESVNFTAVVKWLAEWPVSDKYEQVYSVGLEYFNLPSGAISRIKEATSKVVRLRPTAKKTKSR